MSTPISTSTMATQRGILIESSEGLAKFLFILSKHVYIYMHICINILYSFKLGRILCIIDSRGEKGAMLLSQLHFNSLLI